MQVETELRDMFSYSVSLIILMIILLVIIIIIFKAYKPKIKEETPVVVVPKTKNLLQIKNLYLEKIDKLLIDINNGSIQNRKAYQNLSKLIRNYIYEVTNIKVNHYTLEEIEKVNMPVLYELVKEYYDPEFSKISSGNIIESINKTRVVIEKWK